MSFSFADTDIDIQHDISIQLSGFLEDEARRSTNRERMIE